jgi:hypothetical protein
MFPLAHARPADLASTAFSPAASTKIAASATTGTANPIRNDPVPVDTRPVSHGNIAPPLAVTANTHPVFL